jgi:small-conductance mechanosensitive channel
MTDTLDEWREWLALAAPLLRILLIWLLAIGILGLARRLLEWKQRLLARLRDRPEQRRLNTLSGVLRYALNVTVLGVATLMTLGELGLSIAPLLATAGIAGIAIGFGAQSLVKDFFTGLFLLIENQISEGDTIEVAGKSGVVERVTLRYVRLRDYDGAVHFIPNSVIAVLTNRSREFAYAVIEVNVPRALDLERVYAHMRAVAEDMRRDPSLGGAVLDTLDIAGVEKVEDAVLVLRCRLKTEPGRQWRARREFLRRLHPLLDAEREAHRAAAPGASGSTGKEPDRELA